MRKLSGSLTPTKFDALVDGRRFGDKMTVIMHQILVGGSEVRMTADIANVTETSVRKAIRSLLKQPTKCPHCGYAI